jgi:hypothetical protein
MANGSQRGYLSGILQRGSWIPSTTAPTNPVQPFVPSPLPSLDPISSDLPTEIEAIREPTHPQKSSGSEPAVEQPKRPTQVLPQESERQPTTKPPPEPPSSREPVESDDRTMFSPSPKISAHALPALSRINADLKPNETSQWGERLPRLVRADADEMRGNSINQALRTNTGDQQTVADATRRVDHSAGQDAQTVSTVRVASRQAAETVTSRDDQSPRVKQIEPSDALVTSLVVQNSRTSRVVLPQPLQPLQDKSTPVAAIPVVSGESNQLAELLALRAEPIERTREVVVEHVVAGPREQSLIWSPSPAPRDEFSEGATRQQSPSPRQESPRLTINRLDVQIVNQSVPTVVQLPPPAPVPQLDGWENLERFQLGHLDLIS